MAKLLSKARMVINSKLRVMVTSERGKRMESQEIITRFFFLKPGGGLTGVHHISVVYALYIFH